MKKQYWQNLYKNIIRNRQLMLKLIEIQCCVNENSKGKFNTPKWNAGIQRAKNILKIFFFTLSSDHIDWLYIGSLLGSLSKLKFYLITIDDKCT